MGAAGDGVLTQFSRLMGVEGHIINVLWTGPRLEHDASVQIGSLVFNYDQGGAAHRLEDLILLEAGRARAAVSWTD